MPTEIRPDDADAAWTALWSGTRRGAIDLQAPDDPVAGALRGFWLQQLEWMSPLQHAVDVGSGPAILPLQLRAWAAGALDALVWECVDAASLPPQELPAGWCLRGDTDFATCNPERSPGEALLSNFGLEYVARAAVAQACARWLAPNGRLVAVLHAQGSVIDERSRTSLQDLTLALEHWRLFDRAAQLLEAIASLPADAAQRVSHGADVRQNYNTAVNDLKQRMTERGERSPVWIDMLTALTGLAQQALAGQPEGAQLQCTRLAHAYRAEWRRLQTMKSCALDAPATVALGQSLEAAGFGHVKWQPLFAEPGLIGWTLTAQRLG